jgi:hypothetical protein
MATRFVPALCGMLVAVCATIARTQTTMPPGLHERELAQIIRQAGYDCGAVETIDVSPSPDPAFASMRPEVATCSNKRKFLIVRSGRGGAVARPVVRPLPTDV